MSEANRPPNPDRLQEDEQPLAKPVNDEQPLARPVLEEQEKKYGPQISSEGLRNDWEAE